MILALSRFRVKNGMEDRVRDAFVHRPRRVESIGGFCGLDVYVDTKDPAAFVLLTRWLDEASFREWHASPEHHASHELMPPGLKLDPRGTELVVATRIDCATSGSAHGDLLLDFAIPLLHLIEAGTSVHLLEATDGVIVRANRVFETAAKRPLVGAELVSIVVGAASERLVRAAESSGSDPVLIQFVDALNEPFTLRCVLRARAGGLMLAGEPPADHQRRLEEQLFAVNSELNALLRENTRQARALEVAHQQLKNGYWHLEKISKVLPMCLSCRQVRTGAADDAWETLENFLQRSTSFLSHGYCARCARNLKRELADPERKS